MKANCFQLTTRRPRVRKVVFFLILLMMLQSVTGLVEAQGRAVTTNLSVEKYDWLSNETVIVNVEITNAPYSIGLFANWNLVDESNAIILNGTHSFQATGTVTSFEIMLEQFYNSATQNWNLHYDLISLCSASSIRMNSKSLVVLL